MLKYIVIGLINSLLPNELQPDMTSINIILINGPEGRSCCVGRVEPLRSLLPVRYGKVEVMKNILVPTSFLQVRESSRCPPRRLRYGST